MRSPGRFSLVFRTVPQRVADVDLLDDEDLVLDVDFALSL
jgi:hypothetical protein